jgi:polyisoprenoid-binding protein YceI
MKKTILTLFVIGAILSSCSKNGELAETSQAQEVTTVQNDETKTISSVNAGSSINWRASHLGGAQPRFGQIFVKGAEFLVNNGTLTNAKVDLDMTSFTVDNFPGDEEQTAKLTGHLQSPDFFNTAENPTATFELTNLASIDGHFSSEVTGNLTIMGVTKSISFKANVEVSDTEVSIKSEDFAVNRTDWGLKYNTEGTEGVPVDYLIADDIGFTINVTAVI